MIPRCDWQPNATLIDSYREILITKSVDSSYKESRPLIRYNSCWLQNNTFNTEIYMYGKNRIEEGKQFVLLSEFYNAKKASYERNTLHRYILTFIFPNWEAAEACLEHFEELINGV